MSGRCECLQGGNCHCGPMCTEELNCVCSSNCKCLQGCQCPSCRSTFEAVGDTCLCNGLCKCGKECTSILNCKCPAGTCSCK